MSVHLPATTTGAVHLWIGSWKDILIGSKALMKAVSADRNLEDQGRVARSDRADFISSRYTSPLPRVMRTWPRFDSANRAMIFVLIITTGLSISSVIVRGRSTRSLINGQERRRNYTYVAQTANIRQQSTGQLHSNTSTARLCFTGSMGLLSWLRDASTLTRPCSVFGRSGRNVSTSVLYLRMRRHV